MPENRHKSSGPPASAKTWLASLLKALIAVGIVYVLYRCLFITSHFSALFEQITGQLSAKSALWFTVLLLLVPLNLVLEARKFGILLRAFSPETRATGWQLLGRVLAGLTVGLLTPNRVGEYAGRLTGAQPGERSAVVVATLVGGISQLLPLILGGIVGVVYWTSYKDSVLGYQWMHWVLVGLVFLLAIVGFFNAARIGRWIAAHTLRLTAGTERLLGSRRLAAAVTGFGESLMQIELPNRVAARALGLSTLRYAIYATQLTLAFLILGLRVPLPELIAGVTILYLAQLFMPLPSVLQALARAELAVLLWASSNPNPLSVAAASGLIFVLNLGLPALIGLGIILRSDVNRTLGINSA